MMFQEKLADHSADAALALSAVGAVAGTLLHEVSVVLQILTYLASICASVFAAIHYYKKTRDK